MSVHSSGSQDFTYLAFATNVQKDSNSFLLCVIQYYPLEEVLAAEYLLEDFRPDLIEMVLDKLRPEHVRSV